MKPLSQSVTNILQTVTPTDDAQHMPAHGSTPQAVADGQTITQTALSTLQDRSLPLAMEDLRTANYTIASMQQQGRLTISSVTREGRSPKRDCDGKIYGWEFDLIPTGEFIAKVIDPSQIERLALETAIRPGSKRGIQAALERLAQIKPIGSSEVKQATVISYLTFDLYEDGVSEFVVQEICTEYRKKAVHEPKDRFFPDHGDFLLDADCRMKKYKAAALRAATLTEK